MSKANLENLDLVDMDEFIKKWYSKDSLVIGGSLWTSTTYVIEALAHNQRLIAQKVDILLALENQRTSNG